MVELSEILTHSVAEVLQSRQLTLSLLKIYSTTFLNGAAPRGCSASIKKYYAQLQALSVEQKNLIMNKTNEFKKLVFTQGMHFSNANLSDEKAIEFLNKGIVKPEDFKTLPEGWKSKKHPDLLDDPVANNPKQESTPEKPKQQAKRKTSRKK